MHKPKLAIIVSHPIQHFAPAYQLLGKSKSMDINVIYFSDAGSKQHFDRDFATSYKWDIDLMDGYSSFVLQSGANVTNIGFWGMSDHQLTQILHKENPDVVMLYGYSSLLIWQAWNWARRFNKKTIYFSDSTLQGFKRSWWKKIIKDIPVRMFFKFIDIFLAVGDRNIEYLRYYGAKDNKIRRCPLSVDLKRLQGVSAKELPLLKKFVREEFNIDQSAFVLLFSGKLIERKRPEDLLMAAAELRSAGHSVQAVFLGSGPLMGGLQKKLKFSAYPDSSRFLGFVNQQDIARLQYAADVFVMTSEKDPHPLVVTEAAACGLPIVSTRNAGCVGPSDTVQEGINGLIYPSGNVEKLKQNILELMNNKTLYEQMSRASSEIAKTQDITVAAKAIESAVLELSRNN